MNEADKNKKTSHGISIACLTGAFYDAAWGNGDMAGLLACLAAANYVADLALTHTREQKPADMGRARTMEEYRSDRLCGRIAVGANVLAALLGAITGDYHQALLSASIAGAAHMIPGLKPPVDKGIHPA